MPQTKNPDDLQSVAIIRVFSMHDNSHATMEISKKILFSFPCVRTSKKRTLHVTGGQILKIAVLPVSKA